MNIYQKLLEVRKSVPYLKKEASGQQYQYVGSSQTLGALREKLDEMGIVLETRVLNHNVTTTVNNKGTLSHFTELDIEYTWVNAENPEEKIVIPFYGQGVDLAGEKGVGKALTYSEKYFMLKQFNIPTDKDDPDAFQQKAETYRKPDPITSEQVGTIKTKAMEFANIRGGTDEQVFAHLKIKDITKLTAQQATDTLNTLQSWINKAQKEKQGA